jgi:pimeloyl-ACP methyl ester carboxylesterase
MSSREFGQTPTERPPLFLHQWGGGSTACMLIHGLGDGAYVWWALVRNLPAGYRAYAVDLRGHGYSPRSVDGRYPVLQYVTDVVETLDALALDRVVLVGHSLGGEIAMRIAAAHCERVAALVVVDCGMEPAESGRRMVLNLWSGLRVYATMEEYLRWLARTRPRVAVELLRHCAVEALEGSAEKGFTPRVDPEVFVRSNHPRKDLREDWAMLAQIRCPTLIVRGLGSAVLSKAAAVRMAAAIPRCTLREIEGAGHAVMLENPVAFREHLSSFLLEVIGRACVP